MRQPIVHFLFASLLLVPCVAPRALTQTADGPTANDNLSAEQIPVARTPYTQQESIPRCSGNCQALPAPVQRRPVILRSPRMPYPPGPRPHGAVWRQRGNARHALIGGLIGFGLGAALGAKANRDQHTRARVLAPILFGGGGALIGAAVGSSFP